MSDNKLKKRFVSDYNLPIQVLDDEFFDYYINLYDDIYHTKSKWDELINTISKDFNGSSDEWLKYCNDVKDCILNTILSNKEYIYFSQELDMKPYILKNNICGEVNIYNENYIGHNLLSIDLKKANFQAIKYINPNIVFNCNTYEEFIEKFTSNTYLKHSKNIRQVIFGKLNPHRQITIEKYIMNIIYNSNHPLINLLRNKSKVISLKNDEIIFDVNDEDLPLVASYQNEHDVIDGFDVSINIFKLELMSFTTYNNSKLNVWKKKFINGNEVLKTAPITYYPQIYKFWRGLNLDEKDLYFFHENQIAKFIYPIKLV